MKTVLKFKKATLKKLVALISIFLALSLLMFLMLVSGQASFPSVNVSLINSTDSNASILFSNQQLFWYANYSNNITGRTEVNSTFKWLINNTNQSWGGGNRTAELVPMIYKDAVGYWHLDENGNGILYQDSSGKGNHITVMNSNPLNVSGRIIGGVQFDGDNDYITAPHSASLNLTQNITIALWVKTVGLVGDDGGLVSKSIDSSKYFNTCGTQRAWNAGILDNTLWWQTCNGTAANNILTAFASYVDGGWHHIAVTWNSGGSSTIYIDGIQKSQGSAPKNDLASFNSVLDIGGYTTAWNFNGSIDEVAIYNRTLTASEVKQLYLRTWYDYSPQLFLLQPYEDNSTGLNSSDGEKPTSTGGAISNVSGAFAGTQGVNLSNGFINYSNSNSQNFNEKEGTIEFWVKPTWAGDDNLAHAIFNTETTTVFNISKSSGNDLAIDINGASLLRSSVGGWSGGGWQHVAVTWNNYTSNVSLFINGTLANNSGTAFTIPAADSFLIGARSGGAADFTNATFSEFRISRKELTAQEINFSFSKGRQFFQNEYLLNRSNYAKGDALVLEYVPTDSSATNGSKTNSSAVYIQNVAPPIPTINTPTANSYNTTSTITWTASTDFDSDTITYRVYVNGSFNGSTTATSLALNMTSEKTYAVNISAFDGTDDSGNSTQVQFVYDNIPPRVDNGTNINPSGFRNVNWAFINYTWTEPFNNSQLIRNGTGGVVTNTTANLNLTYFWFNFTSLNDANYTFSAWINDSAGQVNTTTNISITVDTVFPNITLSSPFNNEVTATSFTLSYFVNDTSGISSCSIVSEVLGTINNGTALNVSNNNANNQYNETSLEAGDQVVWRVDCTDMAGNVKSSVSSAFTIAQTLPSGVDEGGGGGGGVTSIGEQSPEPCKEGQQTYYVNSTRYCVTCNGKIEASKNNPYKVTCIQPKQQQDIVVQGRQFSPLTNNQKFLVVATMGTFILLSSNKIIKWKGKVKKKNV